jgi:phosphoglycerate kinase
VAAWGNLCRPLLKKRVSERKKHMKKLVTDLAVNGKKVLVRVDFNVPHKDALITDDSRIRGAIPTIAWLLQNGAKVILMSHLGKIDFKGTPDDIAKDMAKSDLSIVIDPLKKLLDAALNKNVLVAFSKDTHGQGLADAVAKLNAGDVLVVQNTRYEKGETANDPVLSQEWASLADCFVMDAFGSAHRAHASTVGVPDVLRKQGKDTAVGFLMQKEINGLGRCVNCADDQRPYVAILGGSKVSSKIEVIDSLLKKCDKILIGGGMSYTFKAAVYGSKIGKSLFEADQVEYAKKCFATGKIVLPIDNVVGKGYNPDEPDGPVTDVKTVTGDIPDDEEGLDIGPKTIRLFEAEIAKAKTIFWNGPVGVFENAAFTTGTKTICKACAAATKKGAFTVIGGGDSSAAALKFGYADKFSHVSTGGGASLELIQFDGKLPGIDVIEDK